jgi:hypothetical protein
MWKNFVLKPRGEWFELADERISLLASTDDHAWKRRRTLADLRVAILFSECIGGLSRVGVSVQRPGNGNPARDNIN